MKTDASKEVERVLRFFNIPIDPFRIKCIDKKNYKTLSCGYRKPQEFQIKRQMFEPETRKIVESYIEKVRHILEQYGHKHLPIERYDLWNNYEQKYWKFYQKYLVFKSSTSIIKDKVNKTILIVKNDLKH